MEGIDGKTKVVITNADDVKPAVEKVANEVTVKVPSPPPCNCAKCPSYNERAIYQPLPYGMRF
jgi:hypothetical protein